MKNIGLGPFPNAVDLRRVSRCFITICAALVLSLFSHLDFSITDSSASDLTFAGSPKIHILYKNGRTVEGILEGEDETNIRISIKGNVLVIQKSSIERIEKLQSAGEAEPNEVLRLVPPDFALLYDLIRKQDLATFRSTISGMDPSSLTICEQEEFQWLRRYLDEDPSEVGRLLQEHEDEVDHLNPIKASDVMRQALVRFPFNYQIRTQQARFEPTVEGEDKSNFISCAEQVFLFPNQSTRSQVEQLRKATIDSAQIYLTNGRRSDAFLMMRIYAVLESDFSTDPNGGRSGLQAVRDLCRKHRASDHPMCHQIDRKTALLTKAGTGELAPEINTLILDQFHKLLTDDAVRELGLPTREELAREMELRQQQRVQAAREEEQRLMEEQEQLRRYEEEQTAKGLIKYDGKWMTPEEVNRIAAYKRENEYVQRANQIIQSRSKRKVQYKVLQAMPDGALCLMGEYDSFLGDYFYNGELFFLSGVTNSYIADDSKYCTDLYWAGTYVYTTVRNVVKTVNSYTLKSDLALKAVRIKLGLFDASPSTPTPTAATRVAIEPEQHDSEHISCGSGFIITKDGYTLTAQHVIEDAKQITVITEKGPASARIVAQDGSNDVALLKIEGEYEHVTLSMEGEARLGQSVFTLGFPMPDIQGFSPKVTVGVISSPRGMRDDVRYYQIDAAVQPGNSGGPLADESGNILGVIVSGLNELAVAIEKGSLPQNVNYAVKTSYIRAFLETVESRDFDVPALSAKSVTMSREDAVEKVRKATVCIIVE